MNCMAMKRKLDFTNVTDGFELIPKGTYNVHVFELQEKTASTGNEMLKVILKISDGEYKGRQLFTNLVFVETALFKIREFLQACGATIPKKTVDIDFSKCIGKKIKVEVTHRTTKEKPDEPFSDVKKFLPFAAVDTKGKGKDKVNASVDDGNPPDTQDDDDSEEVPFK